MTNELRTIKGIQFFRINSGLVWIGNKRSVMFDKAVRPFATQITRPFWVSTLLVTQGLWHELMEESFYQMWIERVESIMKRENYSKEKVGLGPNFPMHSITYEEALLFNAKLSHMLSVTIQLPSEGEWELAAQSTYDLDNTDGKGINLTNETGWFDGGTLASRNLKEVGQRPSADFPLRDMYGLVWEFVRGRYRSLTGRDCENDLWPDCYPTHGSVVSDYEPSCATPNLCVAKGGSIYSTVKKINSGLRISHSFDFYYPDIGFRVSFREV